MRILKEYSSLEASISFTEQNSIELKLEPQNAEKALEHIDKVTEETDVSANVIRPLKIATEEIFAILSANAGTDENVRVLCTYHEYYLMLVFEFSESALPLHTLNRSIGVLKVENKNKEKNDEIGFMNIVHLVSRITFSVDKITDKMRISVIKEKKYPAPKKKADLPALKAPYTVGSDLVPEEFSERLFNAYGSEYDNFLITPKLFRDNLRSGELSVVFLCDGNGHCAGGAVWQKTYGIIVLMAFVVFIEPEDTDYGHAVKSLLAEFERNVALSGANFIVSKIGHCEVIKDYFDRSDDKYLYKSTSQKKKQISYTKPDLIPLIKKAYKNFEISREIKEINYNYKFIDPHSVLTAKIDTASSEAVLSVLWFGDDLKSNIIRHIIALQKIGIDNIYFRLDLGIPEEAATSDLVQSCGFEAQYLWPYSSDKGDIIVFTYFGSTAYEMKPCEIAFANKDNLSKVPLLVRKVYGDNYPSQYLYNPAQLWDKIRKRQVYPYIAVDDEKTAVGMIAFVKLAVNPYLFEIGQLMVDPACRGTNVVNQLIEYIYSTAIKSLDFDAILSESVTNHKLSQRSCVNSGFCDTALKLNIMAGEAFELEDDRRKITRMSCVVSCIEHADEAFSVYLPSEYADEIKLCFEGLKQREYKTAPDELPEIESITEYRINDDEEETSGLINVTLFKIGADIEFVAEKLEHYAQSKKIKTILINIPLGDVHNGTAVKTLRSFGFFFGGIMPYWFTESDALLMQKLYDNTPDWDNIKLFSRKIKKIAEIIKKDINTNPITESN